MTPWQTVLAQLIKGPPVQRALPEERRPRKVVLEWTTCQSCGKHKGATAFRKQADATLSVICRKCGG